MHRGHHLQIDAGAARDNHRRHRHYRNVEFAGRQRLDNCRTGIETRHVHRQSGVLGPSFALHDEDLGRAEKWQIGDIDVHGFGRGD